MTTQDYINEEIQRERDARITAEVQRFQSQMQMQQNQQAWESQQCGNPGPSELILLRAKVRELTDKLAGERARCAVVAREFDHGWVKSDDEAVADITKAAIAAKIESGE